LILSIALLAAWLFEAIYSLRAFPPLQLDGDECPRSKRRCMLAHVGRPLRN
jgi:hypothetical protein